MERFLEALDTLHSFGARQLVIGLGDKDDVPLEWTVDEFVRSVSESRFKGFQVSVSFVPIDTEDEQEQAVSEAG